MNKATIYGTTYYFAYNVWASKEIAKLCTNGNISNMQKDLQNKSEGEVLDFICSMAVVCNRAANMRIHFESGLPMKEWEALSEINVEIMQSLDADEFITQIRDNVFASISGDSETTIDVEDTDKSKNAISPTST